MWQEIPRKRYMRVGRVFCAQPCYSAGNPMAHSSFLIRLLEPQDALNGRLELNQLGGSLLANCFNCLWTRALNMQKDGMDITHWYMQHDDIVPQQGVLRILLEDLRDTDADLVSAASPIKDDRGVLSTAIDGDDPFKVLRRITMHELEQLPSVFTSADCGYSDRQLLVNTGCWVCRFDRPWRFYPHFEIRDRIVYFAEEDVVTQGFAGRKLPQKLAADLAVLGKLPKGQWGAEVDSEDWNFSRQLGKLGCDVRCTKRVLLHHMGVLGYSNACSWGEFKRDENLLVGTEVLPICAQTASE